MPAWHLLMFDLKLVSYFFGLNSAHSKTFPWSLALGAAVFGYGAFRKELRLGEVIVMGW